MCIDRSQPLHRTTRQSSVSRFLWATSLGLFLLISACSGGSNNSPTATPASGSPTVNHWRMGFASNSPGSSVNSLTVDVNLSVSASQVQSNGILVGRACIRPSFSSESITGSVSGNNFSLTLEFGGVTILLSGTLAADGNSISGTFTMSGACGNDTGTWFAGKIPQISGTYVGSLMGTNSNSALTASITATLQSSGSNITGTFSTNSSCFKGNLNVSGTQTGSQFGGTASDSLGDSIEFAFAGSSSLSGIIQVDTGACASGVADATLAQSH
jgi:hypothetical protein